MNRNVCIHGHFYQPPRENPWTGEVDVEESAKPFHDWNERIAKECYEANAHAPILNAKGEVASRVNNYSKISFDFGPTLLSWMKRRDPATYRAVLEADRQSAQARGGHGNAMAQIYNHVIMPLASKRDRWTQVSWGIQDFQFHFGRKPEGMWLSEAAVDRETLKILADQGVLFTILAPHQAYRVRRTGFGQRWHYVPNESIDTRHPYRIVLEQGRHFHIFFYDPGVSRAIAFQGLLNNGDTLNQRLLGAFSHRSDRTQLVSTATDGESFGHHHRFGEMAIAYATKKMEENRSARITNYGEYLARVGSNWEVDIHDNSSWSCPHGVERWRADCGCRLRFEAGWNQRWRPVMREAFDFLKEIADRVFEGETGRFLKDPWQARNDYVRVLLHDTPGERAHFITRQSRRALNAEEEKKLWDLLEAQKFSMFMYTSCGWFFDDISGIEPVQVMKFALRAMELVQPYFDKPIEGAFMRILEGAKSNFPELGTGADVFKNQVKPARNARTFQKIEAGPGTGRD